MKRLALPAALALAFTATLTFAQQPAAPTAPPDAQQHHGHHMGRHAGMKDPHKHALMLSHRLNLSADQTAKLEPILTARQQKVSALQADTALTPDQRREQFRAIHKDTKQQLDAVLTPEQREQMKSLHHGHGRHGHEQQEGQQPPTGF